MFHVYRQTDKRKGMSQPIIDLCIYLLFVDITHSALTQTNIIIQINYQPDATIFQFIILMFIYSSTGFGRFPAHHQELNDCTGSLWFYLRIVVIVVLFSWSGRPVASGW